MVRNLKKREKKKVLSAHQSYPTRDKSRNDRRLQDCLVLSTKNIGLEVLLISGASAHNKLVYSPLVCPRHAPLAAKPGKR